MPYLAAQSWELGVHYEPDAPVTCAFGPCLSGVLEPGAVLDITSTYNEGVVALLGSADPFSTADASSAYDEGTIPWPSGVAGSGGATTMQIAEISVPTNGPSFMCHVSEQAW
jgi:hypothetical protein